MHTIIRIMEVFAVVLLSFVLRGHVMAKTPALTPSPISTSSPVPVEYVLPYPGLLPTHPLYVLKSFRDKIIEMLISDPVQKADFYILQADKKLNMASALRSMKRESEATQVLSESLASRTQAVSTLEMHAKSGSTIPAHILEKLSRSLTKHIEVLRGMGGSIEPVEALNQRSQRVLGVE